MPAHYRKNEFPMKKYSGKRRTRNYWRGTKQVVHDVLYLKSIINSELKEFNITRTSSTMPATGSILHISSITQGDNVSERTGNSIMPKYVNAKLCFLKSASNTDITDIVRVIFFIWKENTLPVAADILEQVNVFGHYNREHKGGNARDRQITVLYDRTWVLVKGERPCVNVKLDMQMNRIGTKDPLHIKFDGTATANPRNGLYQLSIGQEGAANFSTQTGQILFKYYDN